MGVIPGSLSACQMALPRWGPCIALWLCPRSVETDEAAGIARTHLFSQARADDEIESHLSKTDSISQNRPISCCHSTAKGAATTCGVIGPNQENYYACSCRSQRFLERQPLPVRPVRSWRVGLRIGLQFHRVHHEQTRSVSERKSYVDLFSAGARDCSELRARSSTSSATINR